jgi:hypothetical protein
MQREKNLCILCASAVKKTLRLKNAQQKVILLPLLQQHHSTGQDISG